MEYNYPLRMRQYFPERNGTLVVDFTDLREGTVVSWDGITDKRWVPGYSVTRWGAHTGSRWTPVPTIDLGI